MYTFKLATGQEVFYAIAWVRLDDLETLVTI